MKLGRVLLIEDDEWVVATTGKGLRDAGYEVSVVGTAMEGYKRAVAENPDCIVCDVLLPDVDGYYVARKIRTEPSAVATTPFLFLSASDDPRERLQGFHVGGDAQLKKPFRLEELVAQVNALIEMAQRLREGRDSLRSAPPSGPVAIRGDIAQMSVATVLSILELERKSGRLRLKREDRRAEIAVGEGMIVDVNVDGVSWPTMAALGEVLHWPDGSFRFTPRENLEPTSRRDPIGPSLLEAMRLQDEAAQKR